MTTVLPTALMVITVYWRVLTKVAMVLVDLMTPTKLLRAWMMTTVLLMVLMMIIIRRGVLTKRTTVPRDLMTTQCS